MSNYDHLIPGLAIFVLGMSGILWFLFRNSREIDRSARAARMQQATAAAGTNAPRSHRTADPGTSSGSGADPALLTTTLLAATTASSSDSDVSCSSSSGTGDSSSSDSGSSSC